MSGGSLNYLGSRILTESEGDLEGAARMLREHGHPEAAARTDRVIEALRLAQSIHDEMAEVFRVCDRRGSGDDGPEDVARVVEAWRAAQRPRGDVEKPEEQIARLEADLRDARERLRQQHEQHRQAQEETGADFWEEGTRAAGERVRLCKARLEAARDMREACAQAAEDASDAAPLGTRQSTAAHIVAAIRGVPREPAVEVHGVAGLKGLAVPIGAACGEAHEVGHDRHALCTEKPGHEGDHVSRGGGGREAARWPRKDDRKVRAHAARLRAVFAVAFDKAGAEPQPGAGSEAGWMAVARASLDAMVSAAACVERAAHQRGVSDGLKMRDEAAQIAIDNLRETHEQSLAEEREKAARAADEHERAKVLLRRRAAEIDEAHEAGAAAERGACARIAETPFEMGAEFRPRSAGEIASLIRARGPADRPKDEECTVGHLLGECPRRVAACTRGATS